MAACRHAHLTLVKKRAPGAGGTGSFEIAIVEHDHRTVAAEFQGNPFESAPGKLTHPSSHCRGASEGYQADRWRRHQRFTDVGSAGHHTQETGRQTGFLEETGEEKAAGNGRMWIGLENHSVTQC